LVGEAKKVIINADDFGLSENVNQGILAGYRAGSITSVSILPNGESLQEALEAIKDTPDLGLGIHLALVFGKPTAPPSKVSSLLFRNSEFAEGYPQFVKRYFSGGIKLSHIEYEWETQREKLSAVEIDHIDSHQHLHLLPALFGLTMQLASKWGVKFIRLPYENIRIGIESPQVLSMRVLNCFCWGKRGKLKRAGLSTSDNFFGSSFSGVLTQNALLKLVSVVPPGVTEIMCHPGKDNPKLRESYGWRLH
jgi:predicted glycoside hydrolase/deacetylase ChbG (UPF0249 family)